MNFFGHVVVTSWRSADPAVALGAMLPDFANMCRGRMVEARDAAVAEGVALHHLTDDVFHRMDAFTELERDACKRLQARGVRRGGAMGTAHVAVELLLDGVLLDDARAATLYLEALACGPARDPDAIVWQAAEEKARWLGLRARLSAMGLPEAYRDPSAVADRVALILSGSTSLALNAWEIERVRAEMAPLRDRVARSAPRIMDGLRRAPRVVDGPLSAPRVVDGPLSAPRVVDGLRRGFGSS